MTRALIWLFLVLLVGCSGQKTPMTTPSVNPSTPSESSSPSFASTLGSMVSNMTLEQKIGQVMVVGIDGTTLTPELYQMIQQLHIGGVILYDRNIESPSQVAQLTADLQSVSRKSGDPGLFVTIDQEGGIVARLREAKGFTEFPGQMAVAATGNLDTARSVARAISAELLALGINMDLTPDLDVNNNPSNPIIGVRSFGSDPARVTEFGVAYIQAMQSAGVIAIGKHFPGHGDTAVDSHVSLPTVPHGRERLDAVELVPFKAAMKAGVAGIMTAHITFPAIDPTPGLAATLSDKVLTDLVRREMRYDGLVMTDELTMGALATSGYPAPHAAATSLRAGADVLLFQTGYAMHRQVHQTILEHIQRGEISPGRLDEAVYRILAIKQRFGILSAQPQSLDGTAKQIGTLEIKAISREAASQAVTLVRDEAHSIPLQPDGPLLVVETGNIGLGKLLGATTRQVSAQPRQDEIASILRTAEDGRTVIVATTDVARNRAQGELVNALLQTRSPVIVVATRSPYDLLYFKSAPTFLATFGVNPPMLEALVAILTGKANPRGRLPVDLPG